MWNYRGIGSRETRIHLKEMIETHKPYLFVLLEAKVHNNRIMGFLVNIGYTNMMAMDACGFAGGIWLLWDCYRVGIKEVVMTDQMVTVMV